MNCSNFSVDNMPIGGGILNLKIHVQRLEAEGGGVDLRDENISIWRTLVEMLFDAFFGMLCVLC